MNPSNGRSSSRIRKIAPETDNAQTSSVTITVGLGGENRLKLVNKIVSQKTKTTRNGRGIELVLCANSNHRAWVRSMVIFEAWAWSERCASVFGESSSIFRKNSSGAVVGSTW